MSIADDLTTWLPRGAAVSLWALGAAFLAWLLFGAGADSVSGVWWAGLLALLPGSMLCWRAAGPIGPWRRFVREHLDWHLLAVSLLFVLAAEHRFHWQITSDGGLYFANLRSLVFDGDLHIRPELAVLDLSDRPHSIVPVGPSLVWAPLYLLVAAVDALVGLAPATGAAHGLQGAYVRAALVSSWLCAAIGVALIHWRLRREFERIPSLLTSLLLLGATPLAYYLAVEPAMPHAASFGAVAAALTAGDAWCRRGLPSGRHAWIIGNLVGLAFLIRPQDGLFGIFAVVAIAAAGASPTLRRQAANRLAWIVAGIAPFLLVQAVFAWAVMQANPVPYQLVGGGGYLDLASPRWLDVLFSSRHGLLSWSPVVTVALVGTVAYAWREKTWALPALIVFGAMCWINGSTTDWWGGAAFGGRRFTSVLGALAPGLAVIVVAVLRRPLLILAPVAGGVVFWNYLLMMQFEDGLMTRDEAIGFDRLIRQQAEVYVRPPYFYPFAFPANAWFAWRHKVSIDRYDLLGPEPLRVSVDVPFDAWGARFLVEGWRRVEDDEFGARHFLDGEAGTMLVPLDLTAQRRYGIEVRARAGRHGSSQDPVVLAVEVNGRYVGRFALPLGAAPTTTRFTVPTDERGRPWHRGYNRVTFRRLRSDSPRHDAGPGPGPDVAVYLVRLGPDIHSPSTP